MSRTSNFRKVEKLALMPMRDKIQMDRQKKRSNWMKSNKWLKIHNLLKEMIHPFKALMQIFCNKLTVILQTMRVTAVKLKRWGSSKKCLKVKEVREVVGQHRHSKVKKKGTSWLEDISVLKNLKKLLKFTIKSDNGIKIVNRLRLKIKHWLLSLTKSLK